MFSKCPQEIKDKFAGRIKVFINDKYDLVLNNHPLFGKLNGLRSINISGDYRVIFEERSEDIILMAIGTHSQLYK